MLFGGVLAFNGRASLPLMMATRSTKELTGARTAGDQAARAFGSTVSGGAG